MRSFATTIPLFLPFLVLSVVVGIVVAPRTARYLGISTGHAFVLVASLGSIIAATLTPDADALFAGIGTDVGCDLSVTHWPTLSQLTRVSETSLNVALFVPLGIAVGLLPVSVRSAGMAIGAISLTFVVEGIQLGLPLLGRGCQGVDLATNSLGLLIGVATALFGRGCLAILRMGSPRREDG